MAEKIIDKELLERIIWEDANGYEAVTEEIGDQGRWSVFMTSVFRRLSDGKLFMAQWQKAATEMQEHEYPDEAVECEAYDMTVTSYRPVEP